MNRYRGVNGVKEANGSSEVCEAINFTYCAFDRNRLTCRISSRCVLSIQNRVCDEACDVTA